MQQNRTWQSRLNEIQEMAQKTNTFVHNLTCRKQYFKLMAAIERKDAPTTKRLIARMGF